jgi:hypothetical protein
MTGAYGLWKSDVVVLPTQLYTPTAFIPGERNLPSLANVGWARDLG